MTEETFLDDLALAEGELIDDYVGGRLGAAEREEFERHFLTTDVRRRQLRFAQALGRYADEQAPAPAASVRPAPGWVERFRALWGSLTPVPRGALALACVAVVAFALWLALPGGPREPRTFVALALAAGSGVRAGDGAEVPPVRLPLGADALKLELALPAGAEPAASYRAELVTSKGRAEGVGVAGREGRTVTVVVPESKLARGEYAVRLYAVGADKAERQVGDSYLFKVE